MAFYPAPTAEIEAIAKHLTLAPNSDPKAGHYVLDPCAGEGAAIKTLSEALGCPQTNVRAVELDPTRGEAARAALPLAGVLAPCSFFGTGIDSRSFGLIYANPPFDDELGGGGREELAFLRELNWLLCPQGVLVFVAPWRIMASNEATTWLDTYYDGRLWRFADPKFKECVFIGTRRPTPLMHEQLYGQGWLTSDLRIANKRWYDQEFLNLPTVGRTDAWTMSHFEIPACWSPKRFVKRSYTDPEMREAIANSPLNQLATTLVKPKAKRSPLPLDHGHLALTIASGLLDGLVQLPGWEPHVMKGVETKEKYLNEDLTETKLSPDGKHVVVKEVYSECAVTKIHAVDPRGKHFSWTVGKTKTSEDVTYRKEKRA